MSQKLYRWSDMRQKIIIIIIIIVLIGTLAVFKDIVAKKVIIGSVRALTGLKMTIGAIKVGVLRPVVIIKNLKLYNPPGFDDPIMADVPDIYLKYMMGPIWKKTIYANEFRFYLKEFYIIKNKKGALNIDSLNVVKDKKEPGQEIITVKFRNLLIYKLNLKIDRIIFKNYSKKVTTTREYDVNINDDFENVCDLYDFSMLVLGRILNTTPASQFIKFDKKFVKMGVKHAFKTCTRMVEKGGHNFFTICNKFFTKVEDGIKKVLKK